MLFADVYIKGLNFKVFYHLLLIQLVLRTLQLTEPFSLQNPSPFTPSVYRVGISVWCIVPLTSEMQDLITKQKSIIKLIQMTLYLFFRQRKAQRQRMGQQKRVDPRLEVLAVLVYFLPLLGESNFLHQGVL